MSPEKDRLHFFRKCYYKALPALVILFYLITSVAHGQQGSKVRIENARFLKLDKKSGKSVQRLVGDVIMRQDSTVFYCDSAAVDENNNLDAIGNVHISYGDSVEIFGYYLNYNGNTRIAVLDSNVKLIDRRATLYCDHLLYDRNRRVAFYNTRGRIEDDKNVLTSITGRYYTATHEFFFKDSVVLTNPDYLIYADTLKYNTSTEVVYISGPTDIIGKEDHIYSEEGWYDTRNDRSELKKNNRINHNEQWISAERIYYDKTLGYGKALGKIHIQDTVQDVIIEGDTAELFRQDNYGYITGHTRAILAESEDSLYMHADTFRLVMDTTGKVQYLFAFHQMKFYRKDLQGMCDSLIYQLSDSTITMLKEPVLWSDENQLTSDSIRIYISRNKVDSLVLYNMGFIISRDSTDTFNQIKGKQMRGYFRDNELYKIMVLGNAETFYFVREEDGTMIGINKSVSSNMAIIIDDRKIRDIYYLSQPDATLFPEKDISKDDMKLKGFRWIDGRRPMMREDIYTW